MKQEHRSLLAAGLSMLVIVLWFVFYGPNQKTKPVSAPPSPVTPSPVSKVEESVPAASPSSAASKPEKRVTRETPLISMEWTTRGGRPTRVILKKYREGVEDKSSPINLLGLEGEEAVPLFCESCGRALPAEDLYEEVPTDDAHAITFQAEQDGLIVRKRYEWSDESYLLNLKLTIENRGESEFKGQLGLGWVARQLPETKKKFSFLSGPANQRTFLYNLGGKVTHVGKGEENPEIQGLIPWVGIEDRYFLTSLVSRRISNNQKLKLLHDGDLLRASLTSETAVVPPQGRYEEQFSFYVGPKERNSLKLAGVGLEDAVDYGWFSILAIPILELLKIFYMGVKNWGVAIILLTLFIKLLMNPLTIKSMKQMKAMQALQPKLQALKEKYKNDRQKLNLETMALFRTHKVNPMGGCLPILLQMPIYIALYKVIYNAIELYHAPFFGFYKDLAAPDPYFILPVLLGLSMVLQQKITPSPSADPTQKQMMMIMPVMFTAFMLFLPMGLVLYIFANTVSSVIQQYLYQNGIRWRDVLRGRFRPVQP